jgi:hypothetical protein
MKTYGDRRYSSTIDLDTTMVNGQWYASRPGESTLKYPQHRRLGGPQSYSGRCGVEKSALITHCTGDWVGPRAILGAVE